MKTLCDNNNDQFIRLIDHFIRHPLTQIDFSLHCIIVVHKIRITCQRCRQRVTVVRLSYRFAAGFYHFESWLTRGWRIFVLRCYSEKAGKDRILITCSLNSHLSGQQVF